MLLLMILAMAALILLAAGLPGLEFRPGQSFWIRGSEGEPETLGAPRSVSLPPGLSVLLLALIVMFGITIVYILVSAEARRYFLLRLLPIILLFAALMLLREKLPPPSDQLQQTAVIELGDVPAPIGVEVEFTASPPRWLVWGTAVGIALAVVLGVAGLLWLAQPRQPRLPSPLQQLADQAQNAIEALEAGADLQDTILRCYFEMADTVGQARGIERGSAMTPREFEHQLVKAGLPRPPVRRLTRLFEQVRYGARSAGPAEEQDATACLASITQACQGHGQ